MPRLLGWNPQVALVSTVYLSDGSDTITSTSTCSDQPHFPNLCTRPAGPE